MPVDWKKPDSFTRLLAAVMAAHDMKLNYRLIASLYGNGATYDSIEGRFRIIKKDAQALRAALDSHPSSSPTLALTNPSTPKKARHAAGAGSANGTPTKAGSTGKKDKGQGVLGGRIEKTPTRSSRHNGGVALSAPRNAHANGDAAAQRIVKLESFGSASQHGSSSDSTCSGINAAAGVRDGDGAAFETVGIDMVDWDGHGQGNGNVVSGRESVQQSQDDDFGNADGVEMVDGWYGDVEA
ncbi:MAG: hypothetical protein M1827_003494 [Pycnora praestabilis]|nr:MAG: hypothetical protein M1827_003494 [Pycnora praestabilis]